MKIACSFLTTMIFVLSTIAHASDTERHLLVILHPENDSVLVGLKDAVARQTNNILFVEYKPDTNKQTLMPEILENLSKGKEAYEFLKFEESIKHLNSAVNQLKTNLSSDEAINLLREAYLYLAMDYLALDKTYEAKCIADNYICISGTISLDPDLWPPNLIELLKQQKALIKAHYINITTIPSDAHIYIDGNSIGMSPTSANLSECSHYLHITKPMYLQKDIQFNINKETNSMDIPLEMDPLAISNEHLTDAQITALSSKYHVDGILILYSYFTDTSLHNKRIVHARLIDVQNNQTRYANIGYRNHKQATDELISILTPNNSVVNTNPQINNKLTSFTDDKKQPALHSWYENKWLWTACGAVLTGGVIYATTQNNKNHTSSTGTISIKW
ncbi:MAG: PEGA domain-containing protein [bacterium]